MTSHKVVLIVQARQGSTRLPGKVLKEMVPGRTMLALTLERLQAAKTVDEIVAAVPESPANDAVAAEALRQGVSVFRGPEEDVLERYLGAARAAAAELVVRVTSDCPLADPDVVDLHVERMRSCWSRTDFVTNMLVQSFPLGLAVEAMPMDTLERMGRLSTTAFLREHVTTLAYEEPSLFRIESVFDDADRSGLRWTVDYPEDFEFVRAVYRELYVPGRVFRKADVLTLLERRPSLGSINAGVR